ncbi:MAG TPA: hypothetical protein VIH86_12895 [Puia sp.]
MISCNKSSISVSPNYSGQWQWVQTNLYGRTNSSFVGQSPDSIIILTLYSNGIYSSTLNNKITNRGNFQIISNSIRDSSYSSTGQFDSVQIFPDTLFQFSGSLVTGIGLSLYSGLSMNIINDTLVLQPSMISPGGSFSILFSKK